MFFLAFGLPSSALCPYPSSLYLTLSVASSHLLRQEARETCTDMVEKHTGGDILKPAPIEKYLQMVMPALARFNTKACPISSLS